MFRVHFPLFCLPPLLLVGCGGGSDHWVKSRPATAQAAGIVTFRGEPLDSAVVVFQPTTPQGIGSSALTDRDGKFELKTFPPELGAVPGQYTVTISKTEVPKQTGSANREEGDPVQVVSVIPSKYSMPAKSGLTAEIPPTGTEALVFDLKD